MRWDAWQDGGKIVVKHSDDVEPILEHNKALASLNDGWSPSRDMRRAASIPMIVIEQWMREGVDVFNPDHAKEVRRRLNSSEWRHLRTAPGRL